MTTKDQAIAPTSADYAMGYAEGFNDACKPSKAQPASAEDMVIYKAIADNYQNSLKPAPDCRTCKNLESCKEDAKWLRNYCTNGDQYKPVPAVVLWRTE